MNRIIHCNNIIDKKTSRLNHLNATWGRVVVLEKQLTYSETHRSDIAKALDLALSGLLSGDVKAIHEIDSIYLSVFDDISSI
eukprot:Awhi_evm1s13382